MTNAVKVWHLGRVFYDEANRIQRYLAQLHDYKSPRITPEEFRNFTWQDKVNKGRNVLILMELEPVYTTGLRNCLDSHQEMRLRRLGAQYRKVDRGGLATFHGPGQLVAYPILNLRHFKPSVKWYVDRIEETVIRTCALHDVTCHRSEFTGVWAGRNKICAIGIHVSKGITTHGLALNCCTDMDWFKYITPCGIDTTKYGVTSLSEERDQYVHVKHASQNLMHCFTEVFECGLVDMEEEEKQCILRETVRS